MVGIARHVAMRGAIDGPAAVDLEHVFARVTSLIRSCLLGGNARAAILDDDRALLDRRGGEQAEAGWRAADANGWVTRHGEAPRVCGQVFAGLAARPLRRFAAFSLARRSLCRFSMHFSRLQPYGLMNQLT